MSTEIRPYAPGDEAAILELFRLSFGQSMSEAYWRWRFLQNPAGGGNPLIHLMWDGPVLAGHYAVSPMALVIDGTPVRGALSMTTMTHPHYRGRGVFTALAESVYSQMTADGFALVYGFPNEASHYGFVHQLRWRDVYEIPLMIADERPSPDPGVAVTAIERAGEREAGAFAGIESLGGIMVRRDATYLNWRYFDQPERTHAAFACAEPSVAVAVCKIYSTADSPQCDVLEFSARDKSTAQALLHRIGEYARSYGARRLNLWMNRTDPAFPLLERYGFLHSAPITWLGFRSLADPTLEERLGNFDRWHVSMGDSDVY